MTTTTEDDERRQQPMTIITTTITDDHDNEEDRITYGFLVTQTLMVTYSFRHGLHVSFGSVTTKEVVIIREGSHACV